MDRSLDRAAARAFLDCVGVSLAGPPLERLAAILAAFARLPYENLTKLLAWAERGRPRRRLPAEVLADHQRWGAGGTCFSLTACLYRVLAEAGFRSEVLLADRFQAGEAHTALAVVAGGRRWLADPGYLVARPFALDAEAPQEAVVPGERLRLSPDPAGGWTLVTLLPGGAQRFRYRLRPRPISRADFTDRWDESFEWPMMRSLVLCRQTPESRLYLRDRHYHELTSGGRRQRELDPQEAPAVAGRAFGIAPELFGRARAALAVRG